MYCCWWLGNAAAPRCAKIEPKLRQNWGHAFCTFSDGSAGIILAIIIVPFLTIIEKELWDFHFKKAHVAKVVEWLIAGLRGGVQSWLATPSDLLHCWHIGWRWSGGGHSRELIFEAFWYRSKLVNMHNPAHQFVDYSFDFPCNPVKSSSDFDPYTSHYKSN